MPGAALAVVHAPSAPVSAFCVLASKGGRVVVGGTVVVGTLVVADDDAVAVVVGEAVVAGTNTGALGACDGTRNVEPFVADASPAAGSDAASARRPANTLSSAAATNTSAPRTAIATAANGTRRRRLANAAVCGQMSAAACSRGPRPIRTPARTAS